MRALLLGSVVLLGGCHKIDLGNLNLKQYLPKVAFDKMKVERVDFQGMDTSFRFNVDNPYPVDLRLASFAYDLALEDNPFLNSTSADGIDLTAGTVSPMKLPARVEFQDVFRLVTDLQGKDDVGFQIKGKFGVNTPAGAVDVPFDESGRMPTLKAPKIEPKAVRVGRVNLLRQQATLEIDLGITNKAKSNAYGMKQFGYGLDLGGARVASGNLADLSVAAGATETVTLPIQVNLLELGSTVVSAITQKRPLDVRLDAGLSVETPLGNIPLQVDETTNLRLQ